MRCLSMICDGVNNVLKKKKGCRQKDVLKNSMRTFDRTF